MYRAGGGALVLGQDQDQRGAGFNPVESFVGSISQLNIWDRVLTPQQVKQSSSAGVVHSRTHFLCIFFFLSLHKIDIDTISIDRE